MTDDTLLEFQILKDDGRFIAIDSTNEVGVYTARYWVATASEQA